jgi:cell volume regulation protein A
MCEANDVPHADLIFNIVFLCTIVSLIAQGTSLSAVAKKLNLATPPVTLKKLTHFDIDLPEEVESSVTELEVKAEMLVNGNQLKHLVFPDKTLVIMVRRGEYFFVPTGNSELEVGDQLLVITDNDAMLAAQYREENDEEENKHWGMQLINNTWDFAKEKWQQLVAGKSKDTTNTK